MSYIPSLTVSQEVYLEEMSGNALPKAVRKFWADKNLPSLAKVISLVRLDQENITCLAKSLSPIILLANEILASESVNTDNSRIKLSCKLLSQRLIEVPKALVSHKAYHGNEIECILFRIYNELNGAFFNAERVIGRYISYTMLSTQSLGGPVYLFRKSIGSAIVVDQRGVTSTRFVCDRLLNGKFTKKYVPKDLVSQSLDKVRRFIVARKLTEKERGYFILLELVGFLLSDPYNKQLFSNPIITAEGETFSKIHTSLRSANPDFGTPYRSNHLIMGLVAVLNQPKPLEDRFQGLVELFKDPRTGLQMENPVVASTGFTFDESSNEGGIPNKKAKEVWAVLAKGIKSMKGEAE